MLGRTNTGGGGGGLNFKVIPNPKPSTAKENTIWVNTDTPITSWIFSAEEPSAAEAGMVWISVGTSSSVEFNALKKNGIQVYPGYAKQFNGGTWANKDAKIYQGGAWVELASLPTEYQEVAYIQTTGSQYITTDITPSNNTYQVETKIETTSSQDYQVVFAGQSEKHYSLTMGGGKWYVGGSNTEASGGKSSATSGNIYEIVFNDASHSVLVNGGTVVSGQTFTSNQQIRIAKRLSDNTSGAYKYYYFRVKNNSTGKILADLVPCYRKSDSVAGMYDLASKKFYTNSGTGTFIVGGNA